jgi:hypothetical protein
VTAGEMDTTRSAQDFLELGQRDQAFPLGLQAIVQESLKLIQLIRGPVRRDDPETEQPEVRPVTQMEVGLIGQKRRQRPDRLERASEPLDHPIYGTNATCLPIG